MTETPLRIVLLYDVIYPWSIGGGEKIIWELAVRLAARGHRVDVLSSHMWDGPRAIVREGVHCVGICRWLRRSNNLGNRSLLQPLLFATSALRHLSTAKYDVVICNAFPYLSCFSARIVTFVRRIPLAITWYEARGYPAWKQYAGPMVGFFAAVFERATARLTPHNSTISAFTADRMTTILGIPKNQIVIIPCGVEYGAFSNARGAPTPPTLLYVGRLVRHKRVDLLIEAFADLGGEFPELRLKIVGPGAELANLRQHALTLGVDAKTEFHGSLVGEALREQYSRSSIFVLPSELEGFGMVLVEAMAAGVPTVVRSSEHSAAASVVTDGDNALVFRERKELVAAIRRILTDNSLREKLIAGGRRTASQYDWDSVIVPRFEDWIRSIVAAGNPANEVASERSQ